MVSGSGKRALLTGATGFLGSNLARHLRGLGWEVHALGRPGSVREGAEPPAHMHLWQGDVASIREAVEQSRPDVVFHLASLVLAQHRPEQVSALVEANVLLGTQLLEAMVGAGVSRFVYAGTFWQHFHSNSYCPVNLYAATKQAFEDLLAYYVDAAGVRAVTLVLFDSYGPGDARQKLLRLLLEALRTGEELQMSPGDQELDLVHVDDVCRAFVQAAALLDAPGQPPSSVYAVSGGERMSLRALVALLGRVAGRPLPIVFGGRPYRPREVMQLWDGAPLPGWAPQVPLAEGFAALLQADRLVESVGSETR
jgi:nucleoside-diphosphate-sugar epimerase